MSQVKERVNLKLISGEKVYEAEKMPEIQEKGFPHFVEVTTGIWPFKKTVMVRDGWEDLGRESRWYDGEKKMDMNTQHTVCHDIVNIGKDIDGQIFKFCKRCMVRF